MYLEHTHRSCCIMSPPTFISSKWTLEPEGALGDYSNKPFFCLQMRKLRSNVSQGSQFLSEKRKKFLKLSFTSTSTQFQLLFLSHILEIELTDYNLNARATCTNNGEDSQGLQACLPQARPSTTAPTASHSKGKEGHVAFIPLMSHVSEVSITFP